MNGKGGKNVGITAIMLILSVVMLVMGYTESRDWKYFQKNGESVSAVISYIVTENDAEGGTDRVVYVKYTYNGEEYGGRLSAYPSGCKSGDSVEIMVLPSEPGRFMSDPGIVTKAKIILGVIFGILGGIGLLIKALRRAIRGR